MNEQELRQQFEEYKKWRSGFEFSGNENLLMYLFCLRLRQQFEEYKKWSFESCTQTTLNSLIKRNFGLNMYCYKGNVEMEHNHGK